MMMAEKSGGNAACQNMEVDFEVVGWTGTPEGALTLARALRPDFVLLDIALGKPTAWI
jgi:DNA-binding NarL/FixJ family response regulator